MKFTPCDIYLIQLQIFYYQNAKKHQSRFVVNGSLFSSRDESKKLMEIIMSRVVEPPTQEETNKEEIIADYLPSTRPTRPSYLNTFHPNSSVDLVHTPHTSSAAIVEAKKWVEEKRLRSNIDSHPSCGPTLKTDFFSRVIIIFFIVKVFFYLFVFFFLIKTTFICVSGE